MFLFGLVFFLKFLVSLTSGVVILLSQIVSTNLIDEEPYDQLHALIYAMAYHSPKVGPQPSKRKKGKDQVYQ